MPDLSFLTEDDQIQITDNGTLKVEPDNCQTSREGVFSGGDCVTGPATLVEAIAAGNKAASKIDQYLRLGKTVESEEKMAGSLVHNLGLTERRETRMVAKEAAQSPQKLSLKDRKLNFNEVENCFTTEAAVKEAERCLRCYRVVLLATA